MAIIDKFTDCVNTFYHYFMKLLGICLSVGLYVLVGMHVYAYFVVIATVLKKRLGTEFGLAWCAIGLTLLYNICFNHLCAMILKPGSPEDLERIEKLRKEIKNREARK